MKRLILLAVVLALACAGLNAGRASAAEDYATKMQAQQEEILKNYETFLDNLQQFAEKWKETKPDMAARLEKAIEFAKNQNIKDKMKTIQNLIEQGSWFGAGKTGMDVDSKAS